MAEEVALDIEVTGTGSVDKATGSFKSLKAALKEAQKAQQQAAESFGANSQEFQQAAQRVAELRDNVEDLRDASQQLQGTGVERSSQAFSNLGEGIRNLDFDKIKVALQGFKSALAATGITLVVAAVGYLIENFEELSKGSGLLAKSLRFVGDGIAEIKKTITDFTDLIGATNTALDKQGDLLKENADKSKEGIESQTKVYDEQIAIMKANGEAAFGLEKKKQELIIETNKRLVEQTIAYVKAGGVLTEEQRKLLTEQLTTIRAAANAEKVIDIEAKKDSIERAKKHAQDLDKLGEENFQRFKADQAAKKEAQKALDDEEFQSEFLAGVDAQNKAKLEAQAAYNFQKEQLDLELNERTRIANETLNAQIAIANEAARKKDRDEKIAETQNILSIAQSSNESLYALSDLYFNFKKKNLQKGSKEEIEQGKKQFEFNKKLQIATAAISAGQAVISVLSAPSVVPEPYGTILKVAAAIGIGAKAYNEINKIKALKFDSGAGGGSSVDASIPSANIPAPVISTPQANPASTQFDENGNVKTGGGQAEPKPLRAYVVETEITYTQSQVESIKQKSSF